jgi:hypothetical protein
VTAISNYGARDPLLSESGLLGFRLGVEASDWAGSAPELGLLGRGLSGGGEVVREPRAGLEPEKKEGRRRTVGEEDDTWCRARAVACSCHTLVGSNGLR